MVWDEFAYEFSLQYCIFVYLTRRKKKTKIQNIYLKLNHVLYNDHDTFGHVFKMHTIHPVLESNEQHTTKNSTEMLIHDIDTMSTTNNIMNLDFAGSWILFYSVAVFILPFSSISKKKKKYNVTLYIFNISWKCDAKQWFFLLLFLSFLIAFPAI